MAVLERRQGPLVDGTVYQREELLREIEEYHRAAVVAHRGHAKVSITLPAVPAVTVGPDSAWRPPTAILATPASANGADEPEVTAAEPHPNGASESPKSGEPDTDATAEPERS
ncbi:hypothetical protein ACFQ1L_15000 [Phytohabitans flavus]|uniref:hypothetical protein n=1 Tax=Phytohabitans flavus TaxID=1076124 RepID=UPI00364556BB